MQNKNWKRPLKGREMVLVRNGMEHGDEENRKGPVSCSSVLIFILSLLYIVPPQDYYISQEITVCLKSCQSNTKKLQGHALINGQQIFNLGKKSKLN